MDQFPRDSRQLRQRAVRNSCTQCTVPGCSNPNHGRGLCKSHFMKAWRYGDPLTARSLVGGVICVKCGGPRIKGGTSAHLCRKCYHNGYYHRKNAAERARRNARRSYLKRVTPAWADREAIRQYYRDCPAGFDVDHVVPIRGKRVCGLHVLENLQYLAPSANKQKLNKFL
jgi:hypothetical protein